MRGKIRLFGGVGVGKTVELINNISKTHEGVYVFVEVDECTHERNGPYIGMKEFGMINKQNISESKVTLIYDKMNESSELIRELV